MASNDVVFEMKQLLVEISENKEKYVVGDLDLNDALEKTDRLFEQPVTGEQKVSKAIQDSEVIKTLTDYAKENARHYQIDNLVFDPISFCEKLRAKLCPSEVVDLDDDCPSTSRISESSNVATKVWKLLGEQAQATMNTVPSFSFINGTFDADPIQPVKKQRKQVVKDKLGLETKPLQVTPGTSVNEQDVMLRDASRVYTIFNELVKKSQKQAICFYEFVTDPDSFTHTVENIFLLSLLVKEGYVAIFSDDQGLPCIKKVSKSTKSDWDGTPSTQSLLSISMEDWKDIVKTFKFKKAVIPPRSDLHNDD